MDNQALECYRELKAKGLRSFDCGCLGCGFAKLVEKV